MADAKLNINRVSDNDDGKSFVVGHNELEEGLELIFGIPDAINITASIFTTVESTGGVWMIKFKNKSVSTSPNDSAGIQFFDGVVMKRLCFVGSKIAVWTKDSPFDDNDDDWTESPYDIEDPDEPNLTDLTDVTIPELTGLTDLAGKIVCTTLNTVGGVEAVRHVLKNDTVPVAGAESFDDIEDVKNFEPPYSVAGQIYKPSVVGDLIGIGSTTTIEPIPSGELTGQRVTLYSDPKVLNRVGILGLGEWTLLDGWKTLSGDPDSVSPTTFNSNTTAGITLNKGVYSVQLNWTRLEGSYWEFVQWKIMGPGQTSFPRQTCIEPVPWEYQGSSDYYERAQGVQPPGGSVLSKKTLIVPDDDTVIGIEMSKAQSSSMTVGVIIEILELV